jgi:hypothetical protein
MTKAAMVMVVVASGGAAIGLGAATAQAQQPGGAGPAPTELGRRDRARVFRPMVEPVPSLTEVMDQSVRPDRAAGSASDERGFVWPADSALQSVVAPESAPAPVTATDSAQTPATQVPVQPGASRVPQVEIPEVEVVSPPLPPLLRVLPATSTPVFGPTSSFPPVSLPGGL